MTEESTVLVSIEDGIARLILNRDSKLNALDPDMLSRLGAAIDELDDNDAVRVVVVEAAGNRAFCAGADINAWSTLSHLDMWRTWVRRGHRLFDRLAGLRQPTIAKIRGIAYGGGLELALACDLRFAVDTARFAMPEVTIATLPGWAGTGRLPALVGMARAKQMILTGKPVDATTAERWGLVNVLHVDSELDGAVLETARAIAANAPLSVQAAKQVLNATAGFGLSSTLEGLAGAVCASTEDAKEGFEAFRSRRAPRFRGA